MSKVQFDMPAVLRDLAPTGSLRVAVNFGNGVLVQGNVSSGTPKGVVVDLAAELARRLGVTLEIVRYAGAGLVFDSIPAAAWDVCFLAIEPVRAAEIAFTAPYVMIEGTYLVRADSPVKTTDEVDRPGARIAVSGGSAYDLFLTRSLKHAALVRGAGVQQAAEIFRSEGLDAVAGVRQPLDDIAKELRDLRVLADRFMVINQASGTLPGRPAGFAYLKNFIEDAKASGFVAQSLRESGQAEAAVVAPPTGD